MNNQENKSNLILTIVYRNINYLCWFLFAIIFVLIVKDDVTDGKVFLLSFLVLVIYSIKNLFDYLYRNIANKTYQSIKHEYEIEYFKKSTNLSFDEIDKLDLNSLGKNILNVTYLYTSLIKNVGEIIIPTVVGLLIVFIALVKINVIVSLIILIIMIYLLYLRYKKEDNITSSGKIYNDMLLNSVNNLFTIKVLNLKEHFIKTLNENKNEDSILLGETNDHDMNFNMGIVLILAMILLSVFILVNNSIDKVGLILFFILMSYKLQHLLNNLIPVIKTLILYNNEKNKLDNLIANHEELEYLDNIESLNIKDVSVIYASGIQIKIPNFELKKDDTVSIMGKSGQGKSTVINVLAGISNINDGNILFNNEDKKGIINSTLISKDTCLFKTTLRNNLKLYKNITDDEILELIKEANLYNWYTELKDGLDTIVSDQIEENILLRLYLIRAIIIDKEINLLDFGSFNDDIENEKIIANMIKKHMKKKTYVIVTHSSVLTNLCKKHYFIKDHTLLESEPLL